MSRVRNTTSLQQRQSAIPWYLKEDLPGEDFSRLKLQVKALISRNILGRQEMESFLKVSKLKPKRLLRRDPGKAALQRMTLRYKRLFAEEDVEIRLADPPHASTRGSRLPRRPWGRSHLRSFHQEFASCSPGKVT